MTLFNSLVLSTWQICAETGVRLEQWMMAYQDTTTRKVYAMNSDRVREHLSNNGEDGCIIPNEEPCREIQGKDGGPIENLGQDAGEPKNGAYVY